jgi:hypothetical protein
VKYLKAILFSLFSVFLLYRTIELIRLLINTPAVDYSFVETLILAIILNIFITGIFAFPGFVFPTNRLLPKKYYTITKPKTLKSVYRVLQVKYFRLFLMIVYWGRKKNRKKYFDGTRAGLANLIFQSKQSEIGHLASLSAILLITGILVYYQYFLLFFLANFLNTLGNYYPIILQRHHRMRLQKLASTA